MTKLSGDSYEDNKRKQFSARKQRTVAVIASAIVSNRGHIIALKNAAINGRTDQSRCYNRPWPGPQATFIASLDVRVP